MSVSEKILLNSQDCSNKLKLLGKYIVDNLFEAAMTNAPTIARSAGVSKATVTRFVHMLGFNSFADFQHALRVEALGDKKLSFRQEPIIGKSDTVYKEVFGVEMDLMREALANIDPVVFDKAAQKLSDCDHLLLVGGPIHNFLAYYAANFMCTFRGNIHVISQMDIPFLSLLELVGPKSCAIVFTYPRYSSEVQKIATVLSGKKVPLIGITDSKLSPIVSLSKYTLITPQKYIIHANASASVMALLHSLMVAMYSKRPTEMKHKIEAYEKDILTTDMFIYKDFNFANKL